MLKQDYILRMIEQLAQVFGRLMARTRSEDPAVIHREIEEALKDLTGLDFDVLDSLPLPAVLSILKSHSEPNPARILAIAECSFLRSQLADTSGQSDTALRTRVTALTLYLETLALFRHEKLASAIQRTDELINDLQAYDLPKETLLRLFRYNAVEGRFAQAENALFEMLDRDSVDGTLFDEGKAFYRRLLTLEDPELEAGNLPRDEVVDGQSEFEAASDVRGIPS